MANNKRCCLEVIFLDVAHKWLDNTKTTAELIYYDEMSRRTVLTYVHSDETVEEATKNKDEYIDLMFKTMRGNII